MIKATKIRCPTNEYNEIMIFECFHKNINKIYKFDIKYKNQSLFMKFLGVLLFFNRDFMTKYITTIGSTIYFPSEEDVMSNEESAIIVLAHELVHVKQANKYSKILFSILYLFPQCLAFLAFLAPISLWFLLFLICIAPLPAPWRAKFEVGGYTMSLFVLNEIYKFNHANPDTIHKALGVMADDMDKTYFKGPAYWFMWPFGTNLVSKINDIESGVISGTDEIYGCVRQAYLNAVS